jgi:hypothetical protein
MLPLFHRLRSFRCSHLVLHPHHLYAISGMSNLRSFHVIDCHLSDKFHDHAYEDQMEEFTLAWQGNTAGLLGVTLSPRSHQRWFLFLHPDHLRTLNLIPLDAFLDQILTDFVDRGTQFYALRLPWMTVESKSFVPLLERVPFFQELRLNLIRLRYHRLPSHPRTN